MGDSYVLDDGSTAYYDTFGNFTYAEQPSGATIGADTSIVSDISGQVSGLFSAGADALKKKITASSGTPKGQGTSAGAAGNPVTAAATLTPAQKHQIVLAIGALAIIAIAVKLMK